MSLYPESDTLAGLSTIVIATPDEAPSSGRRVYSCLKQRHNEYEVEVGGYRLRDIPGIVRPSYRREKLDGGRITPGASVGRIRLTLLFCRRHTRAGYADIEVRAAKIGYRDEYREMLAYITQHARSSARIPLAS